MNRSSQAKRDKPGTIGGIQHQQSSRNHSQQPGVQTSALLVPWEFLTEKEKQSSVHSATEMIRSILYLNYKFERDAFAGHGGAFTVTVDGRIAGLMAVLSLVLSCCGGADGGVAYLKNKHADPINSREHLARMQQFKQGLLNACLFSVARLGNVAMIRPLMSPNGTFTPYVNCTDASKRTPLLTAIQHGSRAVAAALIEARADVEYADDYGVSPLSLAAYLGDLKTCRLLLRTGAQFTVRDRAGLIPLQYAIYSGQLRVVALLSKKMALRSTSNIKNNAVLMAAAKEEAAKASRKKQQLPFK